MAAAKALTVKKLRKRIYASTEQAAHFHVQVEECKERDETVPKGQNNLAFGRQEKAGNTEHSDA